MIEIIFSFLLIISLFGTFYIVWKKIPILVDLPIERKRILPFKKFSLEDLLHKILSIMRVLTLKIERRISNWLLKLRKAKKKKEKDNYWQNLKK